MKGLFWVVGGIKLFAILSLTNRRALGFLFFKKHTFIMDVSLDRAYDVSMNEVLQVFKKASGWDAGG